MSNKVSKKQSGRGCGCTGDAPKRMVMSGGSCGMGSCPIQLGGSKKTKKAKKEKEIKKEKKTKKTKKSLTKKSKSSNKSRKN